MSFNKAAHQYASTLYAELSEEKNLGDVCSDVEGIITVFNENINLRRVMENPIVRESDKLAILVKIFSGKVDSYLVKFFEFLAKKDRISICYEIFVSFLETADRVSGIKKVELSSAFELDSTEVAFLQTELEAIFKCKLKMTVTTNPELIGGFIAKTDEVIVDASVKNQLKKLKKSFSRAGVSLN
jgi:F-type H+-transporting ATPase subunit delta